MPADDVSPQDYTIGPQREDTEVDRFTGEAVRVMRIQVLIRGGVQRVVTVPLDQYPQAVAERVLQAVREVKLVQQLGRQPPRQ